MAFTDLTPEAIEEHIRRAEERKAQALEEYEAAKAELEWWKQGRRVFGFEAPQSEASPTDDESVTELFPPSWVFRTTDMRPTLRQAIVAVMRDDKAQSRWRVNDLVAALQNEGWLPEREDAKKRVSDLAGIMVGDGQLRRAARGIYVLAPELSAALEGGSKIHPSALPGAPEPGED